ncbi:MAG: cellulase, partial [Chitinophagaceae bacterium]
MKKNIVFLVMILFASSSFIPKSSPDATNSWVRINLLGYQPTSSKVAIWASKLNSIPQKFDLISKETGKVVFSSTSIQSYGNYGPFKATARLNFTAFKVPGKYVIRTNNIISPDIIIGEEVYRHTADFALRYMRQQRSGFNPYLKDSCHTHDGYVLYGAQAGIKDSTHYNASGGWHDASDYLQYATTSANATYHLLMAYRDFPKAFKDEKQANGLDGGNGVADVLDEAKWGLDWLLKMHPSNKIMFNQLADDRDHIAMRIPKEDSQYGKGFERPLYFIDGKPQQRGKFMNNTTGTSSTAAKFTSAFSLGATMFSAQNPGFATLLAKKAETALKFANVKRGVTQTVSVKSPYIYAEDNWVDDMELAYASIKKNGKSLTKNLDSALAFSRREKITPWFISDTAKHYQYYPFINLGHYELAKQSSLDTKAELIANYKAGIGHVWERAKRNAFYRGVPFIWCSNNLTVSFTMQCYWYKQLSGDTSFAELEQANFDWLFGCNPWGTSMVYGLPDSQDTPVDPHSAFTHLKKYPIDGGLVDGPVYTNIYKNLIGIQLAEADEYADFQSDLAVYHDDYGDYSTNEPTMDGTASLVYLLAAFDNQKIPSSDDGGRDPMTTKVQGAIIRGRTSEKKLALVFTGDEFADGGRIIAETLKKNSTKASFFFTGRFYRNPEFSAVIKSLKAGGNYLGAHSDQHLL